MLIRLLALAAGFLLSMPSMSETGVAEKTILIGQTLSLEDGRNVYGVAAAQGAKLYIDQVNADGGVHGRKIILKVMDDGAQAAQAASNARQLVRDGVFILFGSIEGGPSTAVAEVANEEKVPFFGPMAGSPTLRRPHQPYVFPVRAEHREEFRALMNWGKRTGLTTLGMLYADTPVGKAHLENVQRIATELGMTLSAGIPFKGDIDDAQIEQFARIIADKAPAMFFNHGSSGVYQRLIAKAHAMGLKTTFMGVNSGSTQIAEKLGPIAHGMVFSQVVPNPRERKHAVSREFQDAMARMGQNIPLSYGALEGFLTAKALVAGLRATGPGLSRSALIRTLESSRFDLGGVKVQYAPGNHEGSHFVDLSIVAGNGRFVH